MPNNNLKTETHWRVVHMHSSGIDERGNPVTVIEFANTYPNSNTAYNERENLIEKKLTELNKTQSDFNLIKPAFSVIQQPGLDTIIIRKQIGIHSYDIVSYFDVFPLEITTAYIDNTSCNHYRWQYRNYTICPNKNQSRFTVKFRDITLARKNSLENALNFIDRRLACEKILSEGRRYYV